MRRRGDAGLLVTGVPVAILNGVLTRRKSATPGDVAYLLDIVAAPGIPHRLTLRPGCSPKLIDLARTRGMVEIESLPLMAMQGDVSALREAANHQDLSIRMLEPDEAGIHARLSAEAFQAPIATSERLVPPAALRRPGARAYLGTVDGEPVTTALGYSDGDYVGIFGVATPLRHRGRGYGAAVTARAVLDGFEAGASVAYLQSSPLGFRIYERLGFRTLETWSVWVSGPPSRS
jgi:N-acetylglutamate synthase